MSFWEQFAIYQAAAALYALCVNGKLAEIGRIMFFVGLLVLVWGAGPAMVRLFGSAR